MLNDLRKWFGDAKQDAAIFDIVLYGSAARGKLRPGDTDIAVIFREGNLRERLAKVQSLKRKIPEGQNVDMKGILWEELFREEFLARAGIFLEGIGIFDGKPFAERMDFHGAVLFIHTLRGKSHTEKVKFNYVLRGRNGMGMLEHLHATALAPGVVRVPISSSAQFEEVLRTHHVAYVKENVLLQR